MSDEWYVLVDRKIRGPATTSQLRKSLEAGKIHPDTPVRAGTDGEWALIREIPELVPAAERRRMIKIRSSSPAAQPRRRDRPEGVPGG